MGSFSIWHWLVLVFIAVFAGLPLIFFCISLSKTLGAVDPGLREQAPGSAWLLIIPLFNTIWVFLMVIAVHKGFVRMTAAGRLAAPSDGAYKLGIAMAVLWALCLVPYLNFGVMLPAVVVFILYWMKLGELRRLVVPTGSA